MMVATKEQVGIEILAASTLFRCHTRIVIQFLFDSIVLIARRMANQDKNPQWRCRSLMCSEYSSDILFLRLFCFLIRLLPIIGLTCHSIPILVLNIDMYNPYFSTPRDFSNETTIVKVHELQQFLKYCKLDKCLSFS